MEKKLKDIVLDLQRAIKKCDPKLMKKCREKICEILPEDWDDFPIEQILDTDLIEILIKFLQKTNDQYQICDFLSILMHISSAEGAEGRLVELNIIQIASRFVQHKQFVIKTYALILLGNIAMQNVEYCNKIIHPFLSQKSFY